MLRMRPKTRTNPLFYAEQLEVLLADDPERLERMRSDPASVDLLTWNVFSSLDTDTERDYLAGVLQPLGTADLRAPVRMALWTGRAVEPHLRPSPAYVRHIRERAGEGASLDDFLAPIEVPVRIESPDVLVLVDTSLDGAPRGAAGRDRLVELIDAGLVHAGRVDKRLVVATVYRSGTEAASALSRRVNELRQPAALAAALPWRARMPAVQLREMTWQQLIKVWEHERDHLSLSGQPVKRFLSHAADLGLR